MFEKEISAVKKAKKSLEKTKKSLESKILKSNIPLVEKLRLLSENCDYRENSELSDFEYELVDNLIYDDYYTNIHFGEYSFVEVNILDAIDDLLCEPNKRCLVAKNMEKKMYMLNKEVAEVMIEACLKHKATYFFIDC